jgi:WD40 repeat protein
LNTTTKPNRAHARNLFTTAGHKGGVYAQALSAGNTFFTGAADGIVAEWDTATGALLKPWLKADSPVYALLYEAAGNRIWVGLSDGGLHVLDLSAGELLKSARGHSGPIFDLYWDPERGEVYSAAGDGSLGIWSAKELNLESVVRLSGERLRRIAGWGNTIAIAGSDRQIRLWDCAAKKITAAWAAHETSVFGVAFSQGGKRLYSAGRDARLVVWDLEAQAPMPVTDLVAHRFAINQLAFSPDFAYLATASKDKTVKIWDSETLRLVKVLDHARSAGHVAGINNLTWLPSGNRILTVSDDSLAKMFELEFYVD